MTRQASYILRDGLSALSISAPAFARALPAWWLGQLLDLLPQRFKPRSRDTTLTVSAEGALAPEALNAVRTASYESGARRSIPICLALPEGAILTRTVILPITALRDPAEAIRFDFDRLTPFQSSDVAWAIRPATAAAPPGKAALTLLLTPRSRFDVAIEQLRECGLEAACITSTTRSGTPERLPLNRKVARRSLVAPATALAAVSLILLPFIFQQYRIYRVSRAIEVLSAPLQLAETLRHEAQAAGFGKETVARAEKTPGLPITFIARITQSLPDDTYLTALRIHGRQIELEGQSPQASRLVQTLHTTGQFEDITFVGPVVRAQNSHNDTFELSFQAPEPR